MGNFQKVKLGELIIKILGGGTPSKSNQAYWNGSIPWASVKDFSDNKYYLDSTEDFITLEGLENSASNLIEKGTIVIPTRMGLGRVAITKIDVAINQDLKAIIPNEKVFNDFLRWALVFTGRKLQSIGTGSTVAGIRLEDLKNLEIYMPSMQNQILIASVLSAYDNLIENNEKRIKALEEMAQLLYTEWFVKLKFPGHENVKMVASGTEYGMIPEGWEVKRLDEVVYLNPITKIQKKEKILHIPMEALSNSVSVVDFNKGSKKNSASGPKFQNGDTLFARITPCMQNGKNGFVNFLAHDEIACGSTEFVVIRSKILTPILIYFLTRDSDFREAAKLTMVGASGRQRVQSAFFQNYSVLVPTDEIMTIFESIVENNFKQMINIYRLNQVLSKTRDLLIPQLVVGKRILK